VGRAGTGEASKNQGRMADRSGWKIEVKDKGAFPIEAARDSPWLGGGGGGGVFLCQASLTENLESAKEVSETSAHTGEKGRERGSNLASATAQKLHHRFCSSKTPQLCTIRKLSVESLIRSPKGDSAEAVRNAVLRPGN